MPPSEENSDSHTGGNHHQRGIACSGKLVGSPCCPPVSGSAPFSESMLGEDSRRQLHRPAYEVGAGFPLRINRSNHHFREHRRHSDQGLVRHGSSPIWTRSDLLAKDSSSNPPPGTPANTLAGGHDADGHKPARDLHNGGLDTQHHDVATNRFATHVLVVGASRTSASSFFGLPIIRSSDLRDQQQLHAGANRRNVRIMPQKRGKI